MISAKWGALLSSMGIARAASAASSEATTADAMNGIVLRVI
jgi:hypothetical protein